MPSQCQVTGKTVSFGKSYAIRGIAKKKKGIGLKTTGITPRSFKPNLVKKRLWDPVAKRFVSLKLSTAALRTIDKNGINAVLRKMNKKSCSA